MEDEARVDIPGGESSGGGPGAAPARAEGAEGIDWEQYRLLRACSGVGDMAGWNRMRRLDSDAPVRLSGADLAECGLDGADLSGALLAGADLAGATLRGADLSAARLTGADLAEACLDGANLSDAHLGGAALWRARLAGARLARACLDDALLRGAHLVEADLAGTDARRCDLSGADLSGADLRGADLSFAVVDGATVITGCTVDRRTDLTGVALGAARIGPVLRPLLDYVVRRRGWARRCRRGPWPLRVCRSLLFRPFWWLSDYGFSTRRIVASFCMLAVIFAGVHCVWPEWVTVEGGGVSFLHALYLSVVTMTMFGFGQVHAVPTGTPGLVLLTAQVVVGYVLLAALVARLVIVFTAAGPAGTFAPDADPLARRMFRRLARDPRRSRLGLVRKLARRFCEPHRIGRSAMACLLRLRRLAATRSIRDS